MKKTYLQPQMGIYAIEAESLICLSMSSNPADKNKPALGNERFIIEDMENEAAAAGEEDLW